MSTNFNQYLIRGVKVSNNAFTYEQIEKYTDNGHKHTIGSFNGITVIFDGMNGEYTIIGDCIFKSEINQPLEGTLCLPTQAFDIEKNIDIATKIRNYFGIKDPDVQLWLVTHWH